MINKIHVKKGETVKVISGKDKGKEGKVLVVMPKTGKVIVEGINIATKHTKARKQGDVGGIVKQEAPISASKVMYVCDIYQLDNYEMFEFDIWDWDAKKRRNTDVFPEVLVKFKMLGKKSF